MRFGILGPLEVRDAAGGSVSLGGPQQRALLAALLARPRETVTVEQLVDDVWGPDLPHHPRRAARTYISRLRVALGEGHRITRYGAGYRLEVGDDELDLRRFTRWAEEGRALLATGETAAAGARLRAALALWRGEALADLGAAPLLTWLRPHLRESWFAALEDRIEADLVAGRRHELTGELQGMVERYPLRERLVGQLMRVLYQSGRQADALATYQQVHKRLADELGADPGPELQRLHGAILRQDLPTTATRPDIPARGPQRQAQPLPPWPCRRDLPMTGREDELATLHIALQRAHDGHGQVVFVSGEPGIGKTRLVAELADAAHGTGTNVLVGRCSEGVGVPYEPFVEALRSDVDSTPEEMLGTRLGGYAGELARLHPALAERTGERAQPTSENAEMDQRRLFDAVAGWLDAASAQSPLVLLIEDIHEATRPTLLLLRHIARATPHGRLLLLVTYRDTGDELSAELVNTLAQLARQPDTTHLQLAGLGAVAVAELVAASVNTPGQHPHDGLAEDLHMVTAGNALFVQELLASLRPPTGRDSVPPVQEIDLPWSLRQLLADRLNRLARPTVRFLEQAAVSGEGFYFRVVADAAPIPEVEALDGLDQAIEARLVIGTEARTERYSFSHAIMRRALLDALSPSRRAHLHARLAATLEQQHAADLDRVAAELAHHHAAAGSAGDPAKAVRFFRAAGNAAMAQLAYDEAAAHYESALEQLGVHSGTGTSGWQRCDLLIALGDAQQRAGPGVHRETLLAALNLATELDDPDRMARAAWANSRGVWSTVHGTDEERVAGLERAVEAVRREAAGPRATLLALLAGCLLFGDRPRCHRLSNEALELARDAGDEVVLARVLAQRQFTIAEPTTLTERVSNTAELCELADRLGDPSLKVFSRWWRAVAAFEAADRSEVDSRVAEAHRLADDIGEPFMRCATLMIASSRELAWGDLDRATQLMERYRDLGLRSDASDIEASYWAHQVLLHRERGGLDDVAPHMEQLRPRFGALPAWRGLLALVRWEVGHTHEALEILDGFAATGFEEMPTDMMWLHGMCTLAEVAAASRRTAAAGTLRELLAPYAEHLVADPVLFMGSVSHYLGVLATSLGDWTQAESDFDRAARTHERLAATRWHNRTRFAQARLLLARNRPADRQAASWMLDSTATSARQADQAGLARACRQLRPVTDVASD